MAEALGASYVPVDRGTAWGTPWSTTWFRVSGKVPPEWAVPGSRRCSTSASTTDNPGFQAEGLAFAPDGTPIKGVSPRNNWLPVGARAV